MTEPLKLHTVDAVTESLPEKSARLHDAARQAAQDALREAVGSTDTLQASWAALSALETLDAGIREQARQMADELHRRSWTLRAILGRLER
jgi:hypothetical protein